MATGNLNSPRDLPLELQPGDFFAAMADVHAVDFKSLSYASRYLAFVDILGYQSIVSEYGDDAPKKIYEIVINAFAWAKASFLNLRLTLFSDTLVLESDSEHPAVFWNMLSVIDQVRTQLLEKGILIRGAVTLGNHFSMKGVWISPALIRAHRLESTIAQMPRILLDKSAYKAATDPIITRSRHSYPSFPTGSSISAGSTVG